MGVRQRLNENPRLTLGVVIALSVLATGSVVMQVLASRRGYSKAPDSYFTIDDGKSFFAASSENVAPFDYNGKTAVHAVVFQCDGKKFVGYMERYLPEARKYILQNKHTTPEIERFSRELKKPGDDHWMRSGDMRAETKLTNVQCPNGHGTPEAVEPGQ